MVHAFAELKVERLHALLAAGAEAISVARVGADQPRHDVSGRLGVNRVGLLDAHHGRQPRGNHVALDRFDGFFIAISCQNWVRCWPKVRGGLELHFIEQRARLLTQRGPTLDREVPLQARRAVGGDVPCLDNDRARAHIGSASGSLPS